MNEVHVRKKAISADWVPLCHALPHLFHFHQKCPLGSLTPFHLSSLLSLNFYTPRVRPHFVLACSHSAIAIISNPLLLFIRSKLGWEKARRLKIINSANPPRYGIDHDHHFLTLLITNLLFSL